MNLRILLSSLQPVGGSVLTNGVVVAIVILLHIQIATYITGSSTLAIVSEAISMARKDERHGRLAYMMVKSQVQIFAFGSATAILFVLFLLTGLWAIFWTALQQITFWVMVFEAAFFLVEIVLLYSIYANWERLGNHRRARLGMMVLLNITLWWQMFLIDVVASFMLTPNAGDVSILNQILNPTALPLTIHRTIGNLAWAGAVIAVIGAFNYLRLTRHSRVPTPDAPAGLRPLRSIGAMAVGHLETEAKRAEILHWEWVAQWGVIWAVALSLLQPWVGYSYAKEIQLHAYGAWYTLMFGSLSNVFLIQIFLLGMIFILGSLFFWRRMVRSGAPGAGRQLALMVALILLTLLAIQPAWFAGSYADAVAAGGNHPWWQGGLLNPIGNFIPFKVAALIGMVIFGLWSVTSYATALSRGHIVPGGSSRGAQRTALILGVTVSLMMMVMGVLREHSRQPYTINGEITLHQQITNNAPSSSSVDQGQP
ncbi:MAG: cytochrome ubiquinol oxidase subunit I [Candidatus Dormibacteraeota bacterium]|uniref:Cytochrome ubiquinol oxidase subunit I n=1 Tax=Candidatus Amunia macphersoniae TaxID=3127014 RepID=A0A934KRW3_9BACT|nr:cytochrome ubiquinol oxidase subunit I [Candidatus Dormibacteraeota bacterium]